MKDKNCDDGDKAVLINSIGLNDVRDPAANEVGLTLPLSECEQINDCGENQVSSMDAVELEVQHSVNCDENISINDGEELDPPVQDYQVKHDSPLPDLADISVNNVEELDPQVQTHQGESDGQLPDCKGDSVNKVEVLDPSVQTTQNESDSQLLGCDINTETNHKLSSVRGRAASKVSKFADMIVVMMFLMLASTGWMVKVLSLLVGTVKSVLNVRTLTDETLKWLATLLLNCSQRCCLMWKTVRDQHWFLTWKVLYETVQPSFCHGWENRNIEVVTISKSSSEPGIYANIWLEGKKIAMLVDTGATKSILSRDVFSNLRSKLSLSYNNLPKLQLADDTSLHVAGRTTAKIKLGPLNTTQQFLVANIGDEGILGLDFLRGNKCQLDMRTDEMKIDNCKILLGKGQPIIEIGKVACREDIVIPPRAEYILPTQISYECDNNECLVEPNPSFEAIRHLKVASCLVNMQSKFAPVRILNPNQEPVELKKGETIGYAYEIIETETITNENQPSNETSEKLNGLSIKPTQELSTIPEHLVDLMNNISHQVTDGEELVNIQHMLINFQDCFSKGKHDLGNCNVTEHCIDTGSSHPIRQRPRRTPLAFRGEEEKEIQAMSAAGIIQPSTTPWASPVCLVKKKDGSTRFCIDYRKVNECTVKDSYPLPLINDCLDSLSDSCIYSTMDLASGYWQIKVKESDRPKTAFVTKSGLWEFLVLPFGLSNAPSTFERCMETVLNGLQWTTCLIYLDDVIVHA